MLQQFGQGGPCGLSDIVEELGLLFSQTFKFYQFSNHIALTIPSSSMKAIGITCSMRA